ncbi:MAG: NAD(P)-binding domain-containing protein, partial [Lachnospiraceae bacterium]|nr:NAD(P)-binding domain-containing protein [Lachnospiraceae bacterium]
MKKIGIIGAGSWGTALAVNLTNNGHEVTIWSIIEDEIRMLKEHREHLDKLPNIKLAESMQFTCNLQEAIIGKDLIVLAVPSVFTRSTAKTMAPFVVNGQIIVCVAKGIEDNTLMTITEVVEDEIPNADVCVLCGPSHAEEV